jgi:hypothetical protein
MAHLDWSLCPAIESIPGKVSGACVEDVMEQFDVSREQIAAVLDFVAESLRASAPQPPAAIDAHPL